MARKRRITFRLAALAFAGLLANWLVAAVVLNYSQWSAKSRFTQVNAADSRFDRLLPPDLPRPDAVYRVSTIGKTYWRFSRSGDKTIHPQYAHLVHSGLPFRSWTVFERARYAANKRADVSACRQGLRVHLARWMPDVAFPAWREFWLPLCPTPMGLVANTLFYAISFGLLARAIAASRKRRCATRDLCTRCKYPVRDLATCPECGTAVAP